MSDSSATRMRSALESAALAISAFGFQASLIADDIREFERLTSGFSEAEMDVLSQLSKELPISMMDVAYAVTYHGNNPIKAEFRKRLESINA